MTPPTVAGVIRPSFPIGSIWIGFPRRVYRFDPLREISPVEEKPAPDPKPVRHVVYRPRKIKPPTDAAAPQTIADGERKEIQALARRGWGNQQIANYLRLPISRVAVILK